MADDSHYNCAPDARGRNIRLLVAYDGTDFSGWQSQIKEEIKNKKEKREEGERWDEGAACCQQDTISNNNPSLKSQVPSPCFPRTVQGVIEDALEKMHKHPVALTGAGRTDAGVHAAGQTANFFTDIAGIPAEKFVPALNSLLPRDVRILEAGETAQNFHARFSAVSRTYRYHFICRRPALPHESRYNLQLWRFPQVELLNAYGRLLCGETDCSIFAGAGDEAVKSGKSKNRYIYSARFHVETDRLVFEIRANAFLRNMVRSVAGTFLHYEEKNTQSEELREIIASGNRSLAGPTLPPHGLFLWKVDY